MKPKSRSFVLCCLSLAFHSIAPAFAQTATKPNVIIIITDDQGYGEIAAHGNPVIKTPILDKLHSESIRLTNFHVDPTCSPTRAALLTGRYSTRTGVWHTINGRSLMNPKELTMAEVFKSNGYTTAMIGKWHLGDNYPFRPQDQGFEHTIQHLGGGIGNGADYWENDYSDDTYLTNGEWKKYEGYCTDVWFREASRYVEKKRDKPFFLYLATNAPHSPHNVSDAYAKPYRDAGIPDELAKYYGMITNIDENLGRFRKKLTDLGLAENTLLIFMTDNGTSAGYIDEKAKYPYFNAGMRGWKGSAWDGGHRVPCFWHWPKGNLTGGRDATELSAHIDVLPTLVNLLELKKPEGPIVDGLPLTQPLQGVQEEIWPNRTLFVHVQRAFLPPKWDNSACMNQKWRLVDGKQLYDIQADPGQKTDIAADQPKVVEKLRSDYEAWWASLKTDMEQTSRFHIGSEENPMTLMSHDWLMPTGQAAWNQKHVLRGDLINGPWAVDVKKAGEYEITLYRWPSYLEKAMDCVKARLTIGDFDNSQVIEKSAIKATFRVKLEAGPAMLKTWLTRADEKEHGAYFVEVRRMVNSE
ncbi:MAG: arylsulfatase [Akkermansiaceae bacterium]|jgi:arylsulfatase A-like enzyme|nr:arylsulfatase [Luteolibacter sp.]